MKLPAWLSVQVVSLAAIGVLAFLLMGRCNRVSELEAKAAASGERERLLAGKVQVAEAATEDALRRGSYLSDALEQALKAAGTSGHTIATASGTTGPVIVGGDALAGPPPPVPLAAPALVPVGSSPPGAGPACLLHAGDRAEIRASAAVAETKAGNVAIKAQADAYALDPERHLFGGELHLDAKYLSPQVPARELGWGGGLAVALTRSGYSLGPTIASPTFTVLGFRFEPSVSLTLDPESREWLATGQIVLRRK